MMELVFQLKNQNEPIGKTVKTSGVAESPIWTNSAKQKGLKDHTKQLKHMNELFSWFRKETSQNADKSKTLLFAYHCQCIIAWIYNCAFHICKTWWMYGYQWNWDTNVY